jgi:hypothetical protein
MLKLICELSPSGRLECGLERGRGKGWLVNLCHLLIL